MNKKKIATIIAMLLLLPLITGCTNKEEQDYKLIKCTRDAEAAEDNVDLKLSYEVYYKDDLVKKVIATDIVNSKDSSIIEQYMSSYKDIYKAYDGLKHFTNNISVSKNTMTSKTEINYAKIDTDKLLDIEGKEDNVVNEEGKVVLKDFIAFYEKYGAECDD